MKVCFFLIFYQEKVFIFFIESISGTELGTVLTAVTANDVDTNPPLSYTFSDDSDEESLKVFSIDRYSGKVLLNRLLDYEAQREYELKILASDTAHIAATTLTVRVIDVNDNAPIFDSPAYYAVLPGKRK